MLMHNQFEWIASYVFLFTKVKFSVKERQFVPINFSRLLSLIAG